MALNLNFLNPLKGFTLGAGTTVPSGIVGPNPPRGFSPPAQPIASSGPIQISSGVVPVGLPRTNHPIVFHGLGQNIDALVKRAYRA
jgi:hypothetical protein